MKILFASEFFPFPPRHGVELTIARLIERLSGRHEISFVLLHDRAGDGDALRRLEAAAGGLPAGVLRGRRPAAARAALDELTLRRPTYCAWDFAPEDVRASCDPEVDVVFASPAGASGFLDAFRAAFPESRARLVLGINDATHTAYLDHALEVLRGSTVPSPSLALRLLRVPWIALHERRYLARVDAVHVQTRREEARLRRLLGGAAPRIVVASNGVDERLLELPYTGGGTQDVLFMTHLVDARAGQALWFLRRVWPRVRARRREARVFVVGMPGPPELSRELDAIPGVVQCGFAPSLAHAYAGKALSVVPVRQTSGLVTKVMDSMAAGVPVVGLSALGTVDGFRDGVHGRLAGSGRELAEAIVELLGDPGRLEAISRAGRSLVVENFSIEGSIRTMEHALQEMTESPPARRVA